MMKYVNGRLEPAYWAEMVYFDGAPATREFVERQLRGAGLGDEYVARFQDSAKVAEFFNPDQPREHGRWTSGEGGPVQPHEDAAKSHLDSAKSSFADYRRAKDAGDVEGAKSAAAEVQKHATAAVDHANKATEEADKAKTAKGHESAAGAHLHAHDAAEYAMKTGMNPKLNEFSMSRHWQKADRHMEDSAAISGAESRRRSGPNRLSGSGGTSQRFFVAKSRMSRNDRRMFTSGILHDEIAKLDTYDRSHEANRFHRSSRFVRGTGGRRTRREWSLVEGWHRAFEIFRKRSRVRNREAGVVSVRSECRKDAELRFSLSTGH